MDTRARFEELRSADDVTPPDLDALWSELSTVSAVDILGNWRGGDFATGHVVHAALDKLRWHGKRFESVDRALPLICRGRDGELYSNTDAAGGGEASLWDIGFRDEVTATMVYDRQAIFDHFKAVDDITLMGIMSGKLEATFGVPDLYYFWLERDQ
jgi:hypothetical protein